MVFDFDPVATIVAHSEGLAAAAEGHLDVAVPSCPDWTVADLVHHVTDVQWFWATVVQGRLNAPPKSGRPERADPERLVAALRSATQRLARVLTAADDAEPVYTWAPARQDVGFVRRHQVQEAAVHHWDAATAVGQDLVIATPVAADSIEEFLTFSVSSPDDPAEPARPAMDGSFALCATDAGRCWTVSDATPPGTLTWRRDADEATPRLTATASDLLLWLYRRRDVHRGEVPAELLDRFRALTYTD